MLALFVSKLRMLGALDFEKPRMFKITRRSDLPLATRADLAFLCEPSAHVDEQDKKFGLYLLRGGDLLKGIPNRNGLLIDQRLDYLDEGDVIRVDPANTSIKTVWRRKVHSNAFLVTERCNSFASCARNHRATLTMDSFSTRCLTRSPLLTSPQQRFASPVENRRFMGNDLFD